MQKAVNRQYLAKKYNVNIQTIKNWSSKGMPVFQESSGTDPAKYDEAAVHEWYLANQEKGADANDLDLRKKTADTVLAELKVLKANYRYVDVNLVLNIYREQVENLSAKLKTLSTVIASHIPDVSNYGERQDIVETEIIELLRLLQVDQYSAEQWIDIAREDETE